MKSEALQEARESTAHDWESILRASYLFAQGNNTNHLDMLRWLAASPLYGERVTPAREETSKKLWDFISALVKNETHKSGSGAISDNIARPTNIIRNLDDNLRFNTFETESDRIKYVKDKVKKIATAFVERDYHYLIKENGRPIKSEKRDKWSSFVIDFGVLQKGDGFFSWKSVPTEFVELWEAVISELKNNPNAQFIRVKQRYLEMHPDLSRADIDKIEQILPG